MALLFTVGLSLGMNPMIKTLFKKADLRMIMVPFGVMLGTAAGNVCMALLTDKISLRESLLLGAGYGYYSLSSIMISDFGLKQLGTAALLANILRELLTLAFAGFMSRRICRIAPVFAGGATSMDITLPSVIKHAGEEYALVSLFSGVVLTIAVPMVVAALLRL